MAILWLGNVSELKAQPQVLEHVNVLQPPLLLLAPHTGIAAAAVN